MYVPSVIIVEDLSCFSYVNFLCRMTSCLTRALKCQTLGCAVCRKKKRMHFLVVYSGTEVVLNRPGYFYVQLTYSVA